MDNVNRWMTCACIMSLTIHPRILSVYVLCAVKVYGIWLRTASVHVSNVLSIGFATAEHIENLQNRTRSPAIKMDCTPLAMYAPHLHCLRTAFGIYCGLYENGIHFD